MVEQAPIPEMEERIKRYWKEQLQVRVSLVGESTEFVIGTIADVGKKSFHLLIKGGYKVSSSGIKELKQEYIKQVFFGSVISVEPISFSPVNN